MVGRIAVGLHRKHQARATATPSSSTVHAPQTPCSAGMRAGETEPVAQAIEQVVRASTSTAHLCPLTVSSTAIGAHSLGDLRASIWRDCERNRDPPAIFAEVQVGERLETASAARTTAPAAVSRPRPSSALATVSSRKERRLPHQRRPRAAGRPRFRRARSAPLRTRGELLRRALASWKPTPIRRSRQTGKRTDTRQWRRERRHRPNEDQRKLDRVGPHAIGQRRT